jgi:hypothetical protein
MLQASRLFCSCQEATVTLPPGFGVSVLAVLEEVQAARTSEMLRAMASS